MRQAIRFLAILLAGLGLLTLVANWALSRTTRHWFEADLALRSRLAVASARESLVNHWTADRSRLAEMLANITRDERIMAAAACSLEGELLASTESFPSEFSCRAVAMRMRRDVPGGASNWATIAESPSGPVHSVSTSWKLVRVPWVR